MVPKGTKANISLPVTQSQVLTIINKEELSQSSIINGLQTGQFSLQEGDYIITVRSEKE